MGKIRKANNRKTLKITPIIYGEIYEDDNQSGPIETICDQLSSAQVEEKLNGLQALAVLAVNRVNAERICKAPVARIAAPFLCEKNDAIRDATAGALRNLSVCGSDVCENLVDNDILTPLLLLLKEYAYDHEWKPKFDTDMGNQVDLRSDIFLQAINLLRNLSESTQIAIDSFNQSQLLGGILRCLDYKTFGQEIAVSTAQCILVVSENNPKAWPHLNMYAELLKQLLTEFGNSSLLYLSTLSAGILCNVPALSAAHAAPIFHTFERTLAVDFHTELTKVAQFLVCVENPTHTQQIEIDMEDATETEEEGARRRRRQELPTETELAWKELSNLLEAQRLAAETITNLSSTDEEGWCDVEGEDISESESVVDYDEEGEIPSSMNNEKLSTELTELIKSLQLVNKLWQRAQPYKKIIDYSLENNPAIWNKYKNTRISCLVCLQNLCSVLSIDDLGGYEVLYNVWVNLGQQVFQDSNDVLIMEPLTSFMRSALHLLKTQPQLFSQITQSDLELILEGINKHNAAEIRANLLRMLGTLGCLLPQSLVRIIIVFIIESCNKEEDVWAFSEALDSLMDVFSTDDDCTQIILDLDLVQVLDRLEKIFKSKVKRSRRELKERYAAVQTVKLNLTRFAKYIEDLLKSNKME